jgi:hypothetical protein
LKIASTFTPSSRLSPAFLTLDEEIGPSPLLLILYASSLLDDFHLLLDDYHFAGGIRALMKSTAVMLLRESFVPKGRHDL